MPMLNVFLYHLATLLESVLLQTSELSIAPVDTFVVYVTLETIISLMQVKKRSLHNCIIRLAIGVRAGSEVGVNAPPNTLICQKFGQDFKKYGQSSFDIFNNINEVILSFY